MLSGGVLWFFLGRNKSDFKKRLIDIAKGELKKWKGKNELSPFTSSILKGYWQSVGKSFTESEMQNPSVHASYPWSSAFISYLFQKAGANEQFPYNAAHSGYFQEAKRNRDNPKAPLIGYRLDEYVPKVGDLVVSSRESGKGYDTNGHFASHGEVVINVGKGFIETIGGNVGNRVITTKVKTDNKGYLTASEKPFFMVIKNNIT